MRNAECVHLMNKKGWYQMKTKFKMILYLVALLAVVVSFAWITSERNLAAVPLFCLGLAMLVLPIWADSIRDDIERVTQEEAEDYCRHHTKGKYIEKRGKMYIGMFIDEKVMKVKCFLSKRKCIEWLVKGVYREVEIE